MKRYYELTFIANPTLEQKEIENLINSVKEDILVLGGEIKNELQPKAIQLAYPIKKFKNAYLVSFDLEIEAQKSEEIKKKLDQKEEVLRYILFKKQPPKFIAQKEKSQAPSPKAEKTEPKKIKKPVKVELEEIDKKLEEILQNEPK
ncbi:30S ribosomal protein S6 [bacterium]|nr:30S ribosomal protein S6 [bacterium]